jgi:FkbM family methyltransferase
MQGLNESMFYSQFGEDRLLASIFASTGKGLCIEVGANDGINDSTTYYFEQQGWDCLLVEPNPELCRAIRSVRRARVFECAASAAEGSATLYVAEGAERAHGVSSLGVDEHAARRISDFGFVARPLQVPTRRLDDILEEAGVTRSPDFITIDVEGHELEVLKGFSIDRWKPLIIIAEDNSQFENDAVFRYLRSFGYEPFRRTGVNDWYANKSQTKLINPASRCSWRWVGFETRARKRLRKIPGMLALRNFVLRR